MRIQQLRGWLMRLFVPGSALWRANVIQESGLYVDCRRHAGAGHWREYGDFQRGQCSVIASAALPGTGAARSFLGNQSGARLAGVRSFGAQFRALAEAAVGLRATRG